MGERKVLLKKILTRYIKINREILHYKYKTFVTLTWIFFNWS